MKEQRGRGIRRKKEKISNCPNFFVIVQTTLSRRNLDSSSARLRGTKSSPFPFQPKGRASLKRRTKWRKQRHLPRHSDHAYFWRMPIRSWWCFASCSTPTLLFPFSPFLFSVRRRRIDLLTFWIRNQNGQLLSIGKFEQGSISLERCKLELDKMEQKSSFIVTFARWKDPIFSRITIIVRTMLTTAVLADLIFHPRNARNCFLPLYRIYVILLQLTKNTDSPPLSPSIVGKCLE